MKGLQASNSRVTVLKFRHVDPNVWYRSYSYAIWAETKISGLWVFFCGAGGLDSGGWYGDYKQIEQLIHDLGENVTVKDFDIKEQDLERFLLRKGIGFDSLDSRDFDLESFHQDELFSLNSLGQEVSEAYKKLDESFWKGDYAGALRDLRAVVQDALEYVAEQRGVDVSGIREPDVTSLAGKLVGANVLDGRLTPWFQSFASIANVASHGTFPTEADWLNPQIRMRVLGTFVLGRQLLIELKYCLSPYTPLFPPEPI
jgi:DNA-binding ferritin-like protein (Dps family)